MNPGDAADYIKMQCFSFPNPSTRLGNAGRNCLIGLGLVNFDACLFKKVPIRKVSEGFSVQFRAEVFNIFNHTNFAAPTTTSSTLFTPTGGAIPTAGLLSGLVTPSRQSQVGMKIIW